MTAVALALGGDPSDGAVEDERPAPAADATHEPEGRLDASVLVLTDRLQMGSGDGGALYRARLDGGIELLAEFPAAPSAAVMLEEELWIATVYEDAVYRVAGDGSVLAAVDVGSPTHAVATDGSAVFVATQSAEIVRIDAAAGAETARIRPPSFPSLLQASEGMLVAASTDGILLRLDPVTLEVIQAVHAVSPDDQAPLSISGLAAGDGGDLWITLPHRSIAARLTSDGLEVAQAASYAEPPDPGRDCEPLPFCPVPHTPIAVDGSQAWIYISDAAATVAEPIVLRLDLSAEVKKSFRISDSHQGLVVSDGLIWLYPGILGDVLEVLDPAGGQVREVAVREEFDSGGAVVAVFDDAR